MEVSSAVNSLGLSHLPARALLINFSRDTIPLKGQCPEILNPLFCCLKTLPGPHMNTELAKKKQFSRSVYNYANTIGKYFALNKSDKNNDQSNTKLIF